MVKSFIPFNLFSGAPINMYIRKGLALFPISSITFFTQNTFQFGFNFPVSGNMKGIMAFHDDLMVFIVIIIFFVFYLIFICFKFFADASKHSITKFVHASMLEII